MAMRVEVLFCLDFSLVRPDLYIRMNYQQITLLKNVSPAKNAKICFPRSDLLSGLSRKYLVSNF